MKVFVSTEETQGQRENDFCFVPEGEVVIFPMTTCTNESADDRCGCRRSLCGVKVSKATTTAKVVDLDGDFNTLQRIIRDSLVADGWAIDAGHNIVTSMASRLNRAANKFPTGTVVEYRDGVFTARNA